MPRRVDPDPDLPFIVTRARAQEAGLTVDQIRQRVRSGRWTRLAPGVYRRNGALSEPDPHDGFAVRRREHAEMVTAQALRLPGTVIAGPSAAAVYGIPLMSSLPERACLVKPGSGGASRMDADIRSWTLEEHEIIRTIPRITSPARTWIDVSRLGTFADSLVAGDHLLRRGMVTLAELQAAADGVGPLRGIRQAHSALPHLSADRESPLESASWGYFITHSLPLPAMQVPVRFATGKIIGRVDFLWQAQRLIGECDGRLKYLSASDLYAEKRREDDLRSAGYAVVRWGFKELHDPGLAVRIRRVLAHAS